MKPKRKKKKKKSFSLLLFGMQEYTIFGDKVDEIAPITCIRVRTKREWDFEAYSKTGIFQNGYG